MDPSESLSRYGVPGEGTLLWWRRTTKNTESAASGAQLTNSLLKELTKVKILLAERPEDKALLHMQDDIGKRVRRAVDAEREAKATSGVKRDPLSSATDLMALNPAEMRQWQDIFARLDKDRTGKISLQDIFRPIEEAHWSPLVRVSGGDSGRWLSGGDGGRGLSGGDSGRGLSGRDSGRGLPVCFSFD